MISFLWTYLIIYFNVALEMFTSAVDLKNFCIGHFHQLSYMLILFSDLLLC